MKWLSVSIYVLGLLGILINSTNIVNILLSIELMLAGITLNIALTGMLIDDVIGWVFSIIILTVAASESAIGLGILISYYNVSNDVSINTMNIINK